MPLSKGITKRGRKIFVFELEKCKEGKHLECSRVIAGLVSFLSCSCPCHVNPRIRNAAIAFSDIPEGHEEIEVDSEDDSDYNRSGFAARCYSFWKSMV